MPERLKVWQILFLLFPFLIWMAYSSYVDFTRLEEEGGVLYVGKTTKLLYDLGGKWAVVGFPIIAMGVWGYAIWKTLKLSKQADELSDQAETHAVVASKPPVPVASRPPIARAPSGPITPLAASAPPPRAPADDVPPDPSGPKFLR